MDVLILASALLPGSPAVDAALQGDRLHKARAPRTAKLCKSAFLHIAPLEADFEISRSSRTLAVASISLVALSTLLVIHCQQIRHFSSI